MYSELCPVQYSLFTFGEIVQVLRSTVLLILNNEFTYWDAFMTYIPIYREEINFWND